MAGITALERAGEMLELRKDVGAEFGYMRGNIRTVESYTTNCVSTEIADAIESSSGLIQFIMTMKQRIPSHGLRRSSFTQPCSGCRRSELSTRGFDLRYAHSKIKRRFMIPQ